MREGEKLFIIDTENRVKFEKSVELLANLIEYWKTVDHDEKELLIQDISVKLILCKDKSLKIQEKEPFYWLSLLKNRGWLHILDKFRTLNWRSIYSMLDTKGVFRYCVEKGILQKMPT